MSTELTSENRQEILESIKAGRKIDAIKLYREFTGQGLKESKEFIETLTDQLRAEDPEAFANAKAGCGAGAILLVLTSAALLSALLS